MTKNNDYKVVIFLFARHRSDVKQKIIDDKLK